MEQEIIDINATRDALLHYFENNARGAAKKLRDETGIDKTTEYRYRNGGKVGPETVEKIHNFLKKKGYFQANIEYNDPHDMGMPAHLRHRNTVKENTGGFPIDEPEAYAEILTTLENLTTLLRQKRCTVAQLGFIRGTVKMILNEMLPRAEQEIKDRIAEMDSSHKKQGI